MQVSAANTELLSEAECWNNLHSVGLGRLATGAKGMVDIFPVNYLVHDGAILFRSAPGTKLVNLTAAPAVAFEADGFDGRWHWSVVIHGRATRLSEEADIVESGVMKLVSWSSAPKYNYVRITPTDITGIRIDRFVFPRTSLAG
ncbi:pyridoxamine 5'-phosphate oxidase family protein [Glaciihabitans arcticus]|uniref:Pyridoxamine 5'-phosphate oxidase family protein n=1 Tax=Glaciihabitans arcticus TaxID=2668039 RepID=A0A4V6MTP5_9MICO|nr:pyridoxamine 5'-phosphate oxidase family protein [Glaciihabitans arcticus]TBN58349.1 pyridoxamine 5'-phosphate oxidase family protein [Glaciihabitans arcticus]